jgi:uncharacterized protein YvpB
MNMNNTSTKKKLYLLISFIILISLILPINYASAAQDIKSYESTYFIGSPAYYNGKEFATISEDGKLKPYYEDEILMLPLKHTLERVGASVTYMPETKKVHILFNNYSLLADVDSDVVTITDHTKPLTKDTNPTSKVLKLTGKVAWNGESLYIPISLLENLPEIKLVKDNQIVSVTNSVYTEPAHSEPITTEQLKLDFINKFPYKLYNGESLVYLSYSLNETIEKAKVTEGNLTVYDLEWHPLFSSNKEYKVYQGDNYLRDFKSFNEAYSYARYFAHTAIKRKDRILWEFDGYAESSNPISVPMVYQIPELPRGCEVTSLTMLLNYYGVQVDKMTLAYNIKKDETPYRVMDGEVYFGNPNTGFVGDMFSFAKPGLGVYHEPIKELAESYLPNQVVDLTGSDFDAVEYSLSKGKPVWVISSYTFSPVPASRWMLWHTPTGDSIVTYIEHSVLLIGYDNEFVYLNDPMGNTFKTNKYSFILGWNQFGNQAIIID